MDGNNLIVLGLDLSKTKIKFDVQLKQICQNISNAQTAKIALSLDVGKTTANLKQQLNSVFGGINTNNAKTQKPIDNLNKSLQQTSTVAKGAASSINGNFTTSLAYSTTKMLGMMAVLKAVQLAIGGIKDMFNNVIELDKSLTELSKVTDLTGSQLKAFTDKAYDAAEGLGRTGRELLDSVTTFKKAGNTLSESMDLAKTALVVTNIGDGLTDVKESASALISVMRAFNIEAKDSMNIADAINEVSNTHAVDYDDLTSGLKRVSGVMAMSGNSMAETIGMLTASFGQLRNMEKSSSGLITISARLRGVSEDGEAIDGLAPKLEADFKRIANIDIKDNSGELKSTYQILKELAEVYPKLNTMEQQWIAEASSGKRQAPVFQALMQNFSDVETAIDKANNSQNSAMQENEKYLKSYLGVKAEFDSATQNLSRTVLNSDWIKEPLKVLTSFIKFLTDALENPLVQSLITGSLIMAVPKIFSGLKGIGSFFSDYKSMVSMIVHGNNTIEQSNAKVGKSFGESCNKDFMSKSYQIDFINTPTCLKVA